MSARIVIDLQYLASPYSSKHSDPAIAKSEQNSRYLEIMQYSAFLWQQSQHHFCPIIHNHATAQQFSLPTDAGFWWDFNREMILKSDGIIVAMMRGWDRSSGVAQEIEFARSIGMSVQGLARTKGGGFAWMPLPTESAG